MTVPNPRCEGVEQPRVAFQPPATVNPREQAFRAGRWARLAGQNVLCGPHAQDERRVPHRGRDGARGPVPADGYDFRHAAVPPVCRKPT